MSNSPHHDGSDLYVSNSAPSIGDKVTLKVRVPNDYFFEKAMVRIYHDGEPRIFELKLAKKGEVESWYQVSIEIVNLQSLYRFAFIGQGKYEWLNARGLFDHDVHSNNDFQIVAIPGNPEWIKSSVFYQIFPDRFARSGRVNITPDWAYPREWNLLPRGRGKYTGQELYGGDLYGVQEHLDHITDVGANGIYFTPIFPSRSNHRYDATSFDYVDPILGGDKAFQLGFDFSSLEARIQGHYCINYTNGKELAKMLLAEKPNDWHSVTAIKLGMSRTDVKSVNYAVLYGAQIAKIMKMLACSKERATEVYNGFWEASPALKELKEKVEQYWESTDRKYVLGIDGRKIFIRSKHSILNALFQSAGVISTKYTTIFIYQELEKMGFCTDPFIGKPDVCSMIEYHDEAQFYINPKLAKFEVFKTKEEAEAFVKNWSETDQLSSINEGINNFYITLPNIVSKTIGNSIDKAAKLLGLNVNLGFEWTVNKNWYGCH